KARLRGGQLHHGFDADRAELHRHRLLRQRLRIEHPDAGALGGLQRDLAHRPFNGEQFDLRRDGPRRGVIGPAGSRRRRDSVAHARYAAPATTTAATARPMDTRRAPGTGRLSMAILSFSGWPPNQWQARGAGIADSCVLTIASP